MFPMLIASKKKQSGFAPMPILFKDSIRRKCFSEFILDSTLTGEFLNRDEVEKFLSTYDVEADLPGHRFWYRQNKTIQYSNLLNLASRWEIYVKSNDSVAF